MFMQGCSEVATIDWSEHPHMSSRHNKNMTTSHFNMFFFFFFFLRILMISKLHVPIVYE